jgi:DNA-binding beta-propeller fold protein YncE
MTNTHLWKAKAVCVAACLVVGTAGCEGTDDSTAEGDAGIGGAGGAGGAGGSPSLCEPAVPGSWDGEGDAFTAPQAVVFAGDYLVVASTNAVWNAAAGVVEFGEGFLTIIDPKTGAFVNKFPTNLPNPQKLAVHGDRLFVVNTGTTAYDMTAGAVQVTGPGGIDFLPIADLGTATHPHGTAALSFDPARPLVGAPIDVAFVGERAYITSATSNAVFVFNAGNGMMEHGAEAPLWLGEPETVGLGSIVAHESTLYVTNFNSDTLWRIDGGDDSVSGCGVAVGQAADLEGASTPRIVGDDLYVMLSVAGSLERRGLADLEAAFAANCAAVPAAATIAPLGLYPSDLQPVGENLLVVNSGDNQVVEYDTAGRKVATYPLPEYANPWAVAVEGGGSRLAVTEQAGNGVTVFDTTCEATTWRLGNPTP